MTMTDEELATVLKSCKLRIGIDDDTQDNLLNDLIKDATDRVLAYVNQDGKVASELPTAVIWVIKDVTVKMFNRIGDEGKTASGEGNVSNTWADIDLSQYADALDPYRKSSMRRRPGMWFI
ncbi:phage head-tail connector protein [Lactiplantibacillus paraxiangfangensis]|uniref:phage head-tail connector protein n=1 Tax=Lactiplantibacillus paraxiangfangensis TaxID=3076224 RepID=UPI0030C6D9CF